MWIETRNSLVNSDHVEKIVVMKKFVNFYRPETPATGRVNEDTHRDLIGQRDCGTVEEALACYDKIMTELNALRNSPG
jgi:hypothetical protein